MRVVLECSRALDIRTATLIDTCVFGPSLFQREGEMFFEGLLCQTFSVSDVCDSLSWTLTLNHQALILETTKHLATMTTSW